MKRVSGLVLVRETGVGVPNLEVHVLDSDLTQTDLRDPGRSPKGLPLHAKRISSVLTNSEGRFELSTEDLEFPGNESRPDLVLMLLAPADVLDPKQPYAPPTEERLLYLSTVPRIDAGAEEAYVIRLLQRQLDRFQIPTGPAGRSSHIAVQELSDALLRSLEIRDGVRERLAPKVEAEQKALAKAREVARGKVKNLSAIRPALRDQAGRAAFLISSTANLAEELPTVQAKAIADGLARMKKTAGRRSMRLRLSEKDVADLDLAARNGKVSGKVKGAVLYAKVRQLVNLLDLVRVRAVEPSLEELERKYLSAPPAAATKPRSRKAP